jgi:Pyridoxamine 5'-phosphate oxidase
VGRSPDTPLLDADLAGFVHSGVAVAVATRDGDLVPAFTRGWGPEVSGDGRSLTLCVIAPPGSATLANLEANGAIAVAFSPPTIARAVQVKGIAASVREPGANEVARATRHLDAFTAEAVQIGFPAELPQRMFLRDDFVSVTLSVDEVFDQSPGPNAGRPL